MQLGQQQSTITAATSDVWPPSRSYCWIRISWHCHSTTSPPAARPPSPAICTSIKLSPSPGRSNHNRLWNNNFQTVPNGNLPYYIHCSNSLVSLELISDWVELSVTALFWYAATVSIIYTSLFTNVLTENSDNKINLNNTNYVTTETQIKFHKPITAYYYYYYNQLFGWCLKPAR